jgi:hypothetical protein
LEIEKNILAKKGKLTSIAAMGPRQAEVSYFIWFAVFCGFLPLVAFLCCSFSW